MYLRKVGYVHTIVLNKIYWLYERWSNIQTTTVFLYQTGIQQKHKENYSSWWKIKGAIINMTGIVWDIYICTLSVNIKFICTSFRNRQNSEPSVSFSGLIRSEYKWILYLATMYVYCVYPAMSKKSENLSNLNKKDRNKRQSSPFINIVKGVFFVVRVTLVPVSYLSSPSAVHSYRVPGKFIRRLKSLFV